MKSPSQICCLQERFSLKPLLGCVLSERTPNATTTIRKQGCLVIILSLLGQLPLETWPPRAQQSQDLSLNPPQQEE